MTTKPGKFITVEGVEGVGKSTNIAFIREFLSRKEIQHVVTREPGGTKVAEALRQILLNEKEELIDPVAELLLVFAARAQHLARVIRPSIANGLWVLCDRFTDATYAYQGGGRKIESSSIALLEKIVHGDFQPDLTLILDLDPEIGLKRAASRGALDRIESEKLQFFHAVREVYLGRAREFPDRCAVINANLSLAEVQAQINDVLIRYCVRWQGK
ncbi:MAG: dTMP kinase [Pseudohongiellaceae bacterium]